jgi:hypothetical protein
MTKNFESIQTVDGYVSLNELLALVRCPQCGFHHEHDVSVPEHYSTGQEPTDLGLHTSKCADLPRVQYRIIMSDFLTPHCRDVAAQQDAFMARGALRRERNEGREQHRRSKEQERDLVRREKAAKRLAASKAALGLSPTSS